MTDPASYERGDVEPQVLTREELHELIWSEPLSHLAGRFGISDVAIAKTCRKHRIPRPWRGYWQKKQHGHPVRRTPLRALKAGE